ncbi:MAG: thiamine pyrophosphate-dependent enzyme [Hyphomicrobiaceae bacterium]
MHDPSSQSLSGAGEPEAPVLPVEPGALAMPVLAQALARMLLVRRFDEKAGQLFAMGLINGHCHLSIGQEATAVGVRLAMAAGDNLIATFRTHAHMLAAGLEPARIMAELMGRAGGYSAGKGGSMHMFAPMQRFFGGQAIAGATAPIGAGLALASVYRGEARVSWCFLGDGAADQGQVHEAFNLARLWRLPVVFVIENNRASTEKDLAGLSACAELSRRGAPFGIPGWQIDGMDVASVADAGRRAADWARGGKGPFVLEALIEPFRGHAAAAVERAEGATAQRRPGDPVRLVRERLAAAGMGLSEIDAMDEAARAAVDQAVAWAREQPEPEAASLLAQVVPADIRPGPPQPAG